MNTAVDGRFWVKLISSQVLVQYMTYRNESVRSLAAQVDNLTAKQSASSGVPGTSSRAIIGLLRTGKRKTCRPATAAAIEVCLNAPLGSLFVPQVSHVAGNAATRKVAPTQQRAA